MVPEEETHEYGTGTYAHRWNVDWRRISWGAIFAGLFVTLAIFLTLQILGVGIGAVALDLTGPEPTSPRALGIGAAIWWFITGLIALFIGGWVAGRLGWLPTALDRALHGLTTWAFFYAVMFWMLTTALGALVGGSLAAVAQAGPAVAEAAVPAVTGQQDTQGIEQEIGTTGADGAQLDAQNISQLATAITNYLDGPRTMQQRQQLAMQISEVTGQSPAEADRMIANLEQRAERAPEVAEDVAAVAGTSFIVIAIAMLIGAVVAVLGSLAAPQPAGVYPYDRDRTRTRVEREEYAGRH
jgi:hypothetical protein